MSSIKLDIKNFEHVSTDDNTTTLKHSKLGHTLVLAHKALSPGSRKALEALAGSDKSKGPTDKQAPKESEPRQKMAEGGSPQAPMSVPEDQGTALASIPPEVQANVVAPAAVAQVQSMDNQNLQAEKALYNQKLMSLRNLTGQTQGSQDLFGPNGELPANPVIPQVWAQAESANEQQKQVALEMEKQKALAGQEQQQREHDAAVAQNIVNQKIGAPPVPDPGSPMQSVAEIAPQGSPAPQLGGQETLAPKAPAQDASGMASAEGMVKHGYETEKAGIYGAAKAAGDLGQQQAAVLERQALAQQEAQLQYKKSYDALEQERQAHIKDIQDGYIDPNKYWTGDKNGNGGHSKIAAAIGMILAGFNPTNRPNAAIEFLNKQMEMNLEAQKQNLGQKQNLLAANLRQFGNLKDAMDMTRIMQNDVMQNQLATAAAKAQTPAAKAAAMQAAGKLEMQSAGMFQQFAMRKAIMSAGQSGNADTTGAMIDMLRMTNPEMAKSMEERFVPGVGLAKVPLTAEVRGKIVGHQQLEHAAQDLLKFIKTHTTIVPGTPDYATGEQKALALQSLVREGKLGTVYKEGEQPLLDKFVNSNPAGAFKELQTKPQLRELIRSSVAEGNTLKKNYGLPVAIEATPADNRQQALQWAQANKSGPNAEKAKKILKLLGQP